MTARCSALPTAGKRTNASVSLTTFPRRWVVEHDECDLKIDCVLFAVLSESKLRRASQVRPRILACFVGLLFCGFVTSLWLYCFVALWLWLCDFVDLCFVDLFLCGSVVLWVCCFVLWIYCFVTLLTLWVFCCFVGLLAALCFLDLFLCDCGFIDL